MLKNDIDVLDDYFGKPNDSVEIVCGAWDRIKKELVEAQNISSNPRAKICPVCGKYSMQPLETKE